MIKIILALFCISISFQLFATEKILILGDSLTEGYGVDRQFSYPTVLQSILEKEKKDYKVINGGVSGSTTASGMSKLRWFLKAKPTILVIALGANDGLRGIDVSESKKNLKALIVAAQSKGMKVILAGMQMPPNYGPKYISDYKSMFSSLAKDLKLIFIPLLIDGVAGVNELNIEDGIHPNRKGHILIANTVYKHLKGIL